MIELGPEICGSYEQASSREWLVTNGLGGYASGTVAGSLTRHYHGLLIIPLKPPTARTLMLAKLDDVIVFGDYEFPLYANAWGDGFVEAANLPYLQSFRLEGTIPVWTFQRAGMILEKRIWMAQGANTTYIHYTLLEAPSAVHLKFRALVNYRDHHASTHAQDWMFDLFPMSDGIRITAFEGARPFHLRGRSINYELDHVWYRNFYKAVESYRGHDSTEDHLFIGWQEGILVPGSTLSLVASDEPDASLDGDTALLERRAYDRGLTEGGPLQDAPERIQVLARAADQFIVRRTTETEPEGQTVIAGYHWFADWGRDTMIALPGLALATGRPEIAIRILRTFARYVNQGMLPNRFPDQGEDPEYNTVDATLWYVEAVRATYKATGDKTLLQALYPVLEEIIDWHIKGTRFGIKTDVDGLLSAGEPGVQLTWMDAKVGDWVVTPRMGKPVEVNALWYNALRTMADLARGFGNDSRSEDYLARAELVKESFARFWNPEENCLFDVIDGPGEGETLQPDPTIRPNQLLAVSLHYSPLSDAQARAVLERCGRDLMTPFGLRSMAPSADGYEGHYGGDVWHRDAAYHQGTGWMWLIGPYLSAHWRIYKDADAVRDALKPLLDHLSVEGLGTISEIFDGDPPHAPRGCIAQAWSVAEVLRVWVEVGG